MLDMRKRVFHRMNDINQTRNEHITNNVVSMVHANMLIQLREIDFQDNSLAFEKQGWKEDQALYDKLIMEYKDKTGKFLTAWVQ